MTIEPHPLGFFLPKNTRLLMLGSFPPPRRRWSMEFYYPNIQNEKAFCQEKGIGLGDTAMEVIRQKANASDKFLEVVRPIDPEKVLPQIPACEAIAVTGQKALDTLLPLLPVSETPKVGGSVEFHWGDKSMRLYRMPSTSRAYPKPIEEKAAVYRTMFEEIGIL